jgi:spermidine synthase
MRPSLAPPAMLIKRKSIENEQAHRPASRKAADRGSRDEAPEASARKPKYAPVTLSEMDGVRYLHFGTEWVQGAMRLRRPYWIELEYAQQMMAWMLFIDAPRHIVQLGLGTGALTKFCHKHFAESRVTAVELNPSVIRICADMFKLPPDDDRLTVLEMDALDYIAQAAADPGQIDVLQIDLYDATARGPVLDTPDFYAGCAAVLSPLGVVTVNLFGDHPSFKRNVKAMRYAFDTVITLPEVHDGNVVALCFNTPPVLDFAELHEAAATILAETRMPARSWVNGIKAWQDQA